MFIIRVLAILKNCLDVKILGPVLIACMRFMGAVKRLRNLKVEKSPKK